jgi:2-oxoglutarate dehydrogenase E2 component (dihydrolipoamide succinyltransferase)
MSNKIYVPLLPESVSDATIAIWIKKVGDKVEEEDVLLELETDKVILEVTASASGVLAEIIEVEDTVVHAGDVIGLIDSNPTPKEKDRQNVVSIDKKKADEFAEKEDVKAGPFASPSIRKIMGEYQILADMVEGSGKNGKILKEDIELYLQQTDEKDTIVSTIENEKDPKLMSLAVDEERGGEHSDSNESDQEQESSAIVEPTVEEKEDEASQVNNKKDEVSEMQQINPVEKRSESSEHRVPMTRLRARIAQRLVEAQQTAAILTTFNDVDLSEIVRLRKIYRHRFEQVHGIKLGFMSFFVKAATEALKRYPEVNARIDGQDIIYQGRYDIGVAVSTERGLVVPIVRDTNTLGHADIEKKIHDYAHRARQNQLELDELTGGTFSITNGGVFGSMLSTPIINPPQSAILGMHKIEDRPVAIKGEVVIRPMMYLALSYDHRLIDGKTAVSFLVKIKELLEDPASLFLEL